MILSPIYPSKASPVAGVAIATCRLDDDSDIALADAKKLLSCCEELRRKRFVRPRDRERFARGRGFLRRMLAKALVEHPSEIRIAEDKGGKPHVPFADFDFNLSHSGDIAVFAFTREGAVGIDVETIDRATWGPEALPGLARLCFTEQEKEAIFSLPDDARDQRFLEFWTAKEARMKVWGEGMSLAPASISLLLSDGRATGYADCPHPIELEYVPLPQAGAICCVATSPVRSPRNHEPESV